MLTRSQLPSLEGLAAKGAMLTQSSDGEIHFIIHELEPDISKTKNDLNKTKFKKIMKSEAKKPLHLNRRYE